MLYPGAKNALHAAVLVRLMSVSDHVESVQLMA